MTCLLKSDLYFSVKSIYLCLLTRGTLDMVLSLNPFQLEDLEYIQPCGMFRLLLKGSSAV